MIGEIPSGKAYLFSLEVLDSDHCRDMRYTDSGLSFLSSVSPATRRDSPSIRSRQLSSKSHPLSHHRPSYK